MGLIVEIVMFAVDITEGRGKEGGGGGGREGKGKGKEGGGRGGKKNP